jgi:hypothetical protein
MRLHACKEISDATATEARKDKNVTVCLKRL